MKKINSAIIVLLIVFSITACQKPEEGKPSTEKHDLLLVSKSKMNFDQTMQTLMQDAAHSKWQIPNVITLSNAVNNSGFDVPKTIVIELSKPEYSGKILEDDDARYASALMPCRISVFTGGDGATYISRINKDFLSSNFDGVIGKELSKAAVDIENLLKAVL